MSAPGADESSPLSQFLRMAVIAGVENAVQVHVDRGDDLDARDSHGLTPLMLAAAKNRPTICKILLEAGADASLLSPSGASALSIAISAGAREAAAILDLGQKSTEISSGEVQASSLISQWREDRKPENRTLAVQSEQQIPVAAVGPVLQLFGQAVAPSAIDLADVSEFDLSGWEAEDDAPPPEEDPSIAIAAAILHSAISSHGPVDNSANWDNIDAYLTSLAAPLARTGDAEARSKLRLVLLRALREGSVPIAAVEDLAVNDDRAANPDAETLLSRVINDLGAEVDERFEYRTADENFTVFVHPDESFLEEMEIDAAVAAIDASASNRGDPLRLYQREIQRLRLISAEEEVALGRAMEDSLSAALDALSDWPQGIALTISAGEKVKDRTHPITWMSLGTADADVDPSTESKGERTQAVAVEEDPEDETEAQVSPDSHSALSTFTEAMNRLQALAQKDTHRAPERLAVLAALTDLQLNRRFLQELADGLGCGSSQAAIRFSQAMRAHQKARDDMTNANLKLAFQLAKKYLFSGQPLDDLVQEGNIGLIKAVDRYDWRRGFKFSTYATWWIRQQVGRFVADKGKTIRLPAHVYEKTQRIAQAARAFEIRHGESPSVEEIAKLVDLPIKKVLALSRAAMEPVPLHEVDELDARIASDAKDQFTARDPMDIVEDTQLIGAIDRFLETIKPKEARVVRMRYGIGIRESMTLEEIGARLDVTRERIRQIEAKALRRLKHPARLDRLLRELYGASPTACADAEEAPDDADDEANGEEPTVPVAKSSKSKPATQAAPMPERPHPSSSTTLEKLLDHARAIGITVEDYPEGSDRRIWVHITETPDNHSRKIVRKLIEFGFIFRPGKGYWR